MGVDASLHLPSRDGSEGDTALGQALTRYGRAVLAVPCTTDPEVELATLADQLGPSTLPAGPSSRFDCGRVLMPPAPLLEGSRVAQVEVARSAAGDARGAYLVAGVANRGLPSLALALYLVGQGLAPEGVTQREHGMELGRLQVPQDLQGATLASLRHPEATRFFSYGALHARLGRQGPSTLPPELAASVRDSFVLIGETSASPPGATPSVGEPPRMLLHGALLGDLLERHPVHELPPPLQLALILLCGALMTAAALALRPALAVAALVTLLAPLWAGASLLVPGGLVLAPLAPATAATVSFALVRARRRAAEERARSIVRGAFGGYVDGLELGRLLEHPERPLPLEGARRRVSVLAARVQVPPEALGRLLPEEAVQSLRRAFQAMTEEVVRRKGRVESLRGNGLVAVFGDPLTMQDHAQRAVETALALSARLETLAGARAGGQPLRAQVGVATGEAVVGNVGLEGGRVEYAVVGPPLDVALELARRAPGGQTLVSGTTRTSCSRRFHFTPAHRRRPGGLTMDATVSGLIKLTKLCKTG